MVFLAFGVSAGTGAIAGILITPIFFTSYNSGTILGLKGFIAAVLGGWGRYRRHSGGFALGILEALSIAFIPSGYKMGWPLPSCCSFYTSDRKEFWVAFC